MLHLSSVARRHRCIVDSHLPDYVPEPICLRAVTDSDCPTFTVGIKETIGVFRLNLRMLEQSERERASLKGTEMMEIRKEEIEEFAFNHFAENPKQRWNGRQIRNAFQIARSLAQFEAESAWKRGDSGHKLAVGVKQFKTVAEATMAFDEYRQIVIGKTDDEDAAARMERARERDLNSQRHGGDTGPSWRQSYGDSPYNARTRTPQPPSYGYQPQYGAPPQQTTPSPHANFSLGGAPRGTGMTPGVYGHERMPSQTYSQPPPQPQYQQQMPIREQGSVPYRDAPPTMQEYRQTVLPPVGPSVPVPAPQVHAPVPERMPQQQVFAEMPGLAQQQGQPLSSSGAGPPPQQQAYSSQMQGEPRYRETDERYAAAGYGAAHP
jgi:hypothetical protein